MDQLPSEIVRTIAGFVGREDILPFRLTCRSFAALGLQRQFETISVCLSRKSFNNLLRLSEDPAFASSVQAIEYARYAMTPTRGLAREGASNERMERGEPERACTCSRRS